MTLVHDIAHPCHSASKVVRGGGEQTSKILVAAFALCISMFVSMSSVSVSADPRLVCYMEVDLVQNPLGWTGTIEGDLNGEIVIVENPATFTGAIEHFDESFTMTLSDGTVIEGGDAGIFNLKTFKAVANGEISWVSSVNWEWLVGYKVHLSGVGDLSVEPWHFSGTLTMMPTE